MMLMLGLKLLRINKISSSHFLPGCITPLPFLIIWTIIGPHTVIDNKVTVVSSNEKDEPSDEFSPVASEILDSFQVAHKISGKGSHY